MLLSISFSSIFFQLFFAHTAEVLAPELFGCRLFKLHAGGELLGAVIVETDAYCQKQLLLIAGFSQHLGALGRRFESFLPD